MSRIIFTLYFTIFAASLLSQIKFKKFLKNDSAAGSMHFAFITCTAANYVMLRKRQWKWLQAG